MGFSLAYGAMFSKTWRVHQIFTNKRLKRKVDLKNHLQSLMQIVLKICSKYNRDDIFKVAGNISDVITFCTCLCISMRAFWKYFDDHAIEIIC